MKSSALDLGVELRCGGSGLPRAAALRKNKDQMNAANRADVQCVQ